MYVYYIHPELRIEPELAALYPAIAGAYRYVQMTCERMYVRSMQLSNPYQLARYNSKKLICYLIHLCQSKAVRYHISYYKKKMKR